MIIYVIISVSLCDLLTASSKNRNLREDAIGTQCYQAAAARENRFPGNLNSNNKH